MSKDLAKLNEFGQKAATLANKIMAPHQVAECAACFTHFRVEDATCLCLNEACRKEDSDPFSNQFESKWNRRPKTEGFVYQPALKSSWLQRIRGKTLTPQCPKCHGSPGRRVCPKCLWELSEDCLNAPLNVFCLLGQKTAGKTHYLAALNNHLLAAKDISATLQWIPRPIAEETTVSITQDRRDFIQQRNVLPQTPPGNVQRMMPFNFHIVDATRTQPDWALGLYDIAGEDLMDPVRMNDLGPFLFRAHGHMLLIDPEVMGAGEDARENHDFAIMNRFIREYEAKAGTRGAKTKIPTPLAVVLSKGDTIPELRAHVDSEVPLLQPNGVVSYRDMKQISQAVRSYLEEKHESQIIQLIEHSFERVEYFVMSPAGCAPGADKRFATVSPKRVPDPFLWLLAQNRRVPLA